MNKKQTFDSKIITGSRSQTNELTSAEMSVARANIAAQLASANLDRLDGNLTSQRTALSINNVDNTSDVNKPISTATQTALDGKANTSHTQPFSTITDKPTTLAGYGITDGGGSAAHQWIGKKAAVLGTSITQGTLYTAPLATRGLVITNLGIGGGTISNSASSQPAAIYNSIPSIPLDTELVLVEAGINDFRTNATLGSVGSEALNTFYGAIFLTIRDIYARVPNAVVVWLMPYGNTDTNFAGTWKTNNDQGVSLASFRAAIRHVCEQTSVPVIDLSESGVGPRTVSTFMPDGIHPNSAGGERLATYIWDALRLYQPNGATPPSPGWNMRPVESSDFTSFNMTGGSLTGDDFTSGSATTGSFGVNWFATGVNNAFEYNSPVGWIMVGQGSSGACGFGDANGFISVFATLAGGSLTNQTVSIPMSASTRFRVARIGDLLWLEQFVAGEWIRRINGVDIDTYNNALAGFKETVKLGILSNVTTATDLRVGVFTP